MLKIIRLLDSVPKIFRLDNNKVIKNSDNKVNIIIVNLFNKSKNNKSRNLMYLQNIRATKEPIFLTLILKKFLTI